MFEREWKEEDLIRYAGEVVDEAFGRWNTYSLEYDVNYSSILTRLIQEAGRWCERYASDLFIDWCIIKKELETPACDGGNYFFGFRKDGVDGLSFILNRIAENKEMYRSVWMLKVEVEKDKVTMKLHKLNV